MIVFEMLSAGIRSLLALWALLLCLALIGSAVLSAVKKRLNFTVFSALFFAASYYLWQVIFDYSLSAKTHTVAPIAKALCSINYIYWLAAFILLTFAATLLLVLNIRYDKNYITPGAIKLFLDKMPCGVCCWRENGRVLFSNICMNELCEKITDNALLNGNQFHDAVKDGIKIVDGKVWRFVTREMDFNGEMLFETVASDITAEYAKTDALERDKAELSRLNSELRQYYLSIDESVKRQEILQAKMNIHDEMNRLMLSTAAVDKDDSQALDRIFSLWEQNALLLCMQTDITSDGREEGCLNALASGLAVSLEWDGVLPDSLSEKEKELFYFTAQEALINAVKHAQAQKMKITFEKTDNSLVCRFANDGKLPQGEVRFEGGLKNLSRLAEKQGAKVFAETGEEFCLILKYQPIE